MKRIFAVAVQGMLCGAVCAQQQAPPAPRSAIAPVAQDVSVTSTIEPLPLAESDRSVWVLSPQEQPLVSNSVVDYLRQDSSLNLQARAGNGVQADISIRGTTFEQTLILLNGLRINDPETGHLNLDLPVPLDAVTRIDVLHGSGSTFYGSDAVGGAVNLLTERPGEGASVVASLGGGNYGSLEEHLRAAYTRGLAATQLTGSRDTSDGFIPDRNYSSNALAEETWLKCRPGTTDILLAASDRPYGANLFYGPYDSQERTKGWFASVQQQIGERTAASFGYRRHTDVFTLFADEPAVYQNNHITTSYEGAVRRADELGANTTLAYGLEADGDSIHSNSLGQHARNQEAAYANLSLRALKRFSLSVGARDEVVSSNGNVFSPSVAAAYAVSSTVRVRGSASHGFRLPTFVDLYYADPTTIGNPNLKPESSWSYEAGVDWTPGGRFTVTATGFRLQQKDTIDYSKLAQATDALTFAEPYQAVNVQNLNISGAEATVRVRVTETQRVELSYTAAHAASPPANLISEYAFNYAAQNAIFAWSGTLPTAVFGRYGKQINARTQVNVVQRTQHTAYPLWDVAASRNTGRLRPYLRLLNLSGTGYQEIPDVPLQGRTLVAGIEWWWTRR